MKRYFMDTEYNGFGGQLISLALVPEDEEAVPSYEALACANPNSWVVAYLQVDSEPVVTADWRKDIALT